MAEGAAAPNEVAAVHWPKEALHPANGLSLDPGMPDCREKPLSVL